MLKTLRLCRVLLLPCLFAAVAPLHAVVVHGRVTDTLGKPIANANVSLVMNGQVAAAGRTQADGSYQLTTSSSGRFYVLAGGNTFRQLATQSFYGGVLDGVEQDVVLEPEWTRQSIVVTATGTPLPQAQVSASITTLNKIDFLNRFNLVDALRQVAGVNVVQQGQRGSLTSVFIRGGKSDENKFVLDGASIEDIGGRFDLSTVSSTGIASAETYRGPNSVVYGSDAAAGIVGFTTPRGSTPFPSLIYEGDAGDFGTYRNEVQLAGTHNRLDYYGAFGDLQTQNSIPNNEYHNINETVNLGWAISPDTSIRVTARNADIAVGAPGAFEFYHIANSAKQSDQNIFATGLIDHTFSDRWHGLVRYGMTRKREQYAQFPISAIYDVDLGAFLGEPVTIRGANGYSATGQAILGYPGTYQYDLTSNRDNLYAQTDYQFTPHLMAIAGFRYEDERGSEHDFPYINEALERANYDYQLQFAGDFKSRLFYSLGGGIQKNQLYGTEGTPRIGLSYYAIRPGSGIFRGTKLNFNFAKGVKEPNLSDQFGSLHGLVDELSTPGTADQEGIHPLEAERSRSYDGGVEQSLFSERVLFKATYFHNEFGNQTETISTSALLGLLPQLDDQQKQEVVMLIQSGGVAPILNSQAYRAQGVESEVQYGIGKSIFLRGGYTYTDAVIQHSYTSDAVGPATNPNLPGILIGDVSPLRGARPFRIPPHNGFVSATYSGKLLTLIANGAFASRSDDSTFLDQFSSTTFDNSLLLPNRNLDHGFAKIDLGAAYQLLHWVSIYAQTENLLSDQHIGPIGYLSLPFNYRVGLRFALGKEKK